MARPEVGDEVRRCAACGGYAYGGAPDCAVCRALVDAIVEDEWAVFVRRMGAAPAEERALAEMVTAEPDRHDWRVVDAALDRIECGDCGERLGRGPAGCAGCELAHGFRYAAVETDRPGVPPGNEHAVRVNVSVVRRPQMTSAAELLVRRKLLPLLLVGRLPTTQEAQRASAAVKGAAADARERLVDEVVEAALADPGKGTAAGTDTRKGTA
ncbi:hypothetical protein H9Y04_26480 [Streptomyces sp. TRM66268-LWL]|uniref:Uncharacterized protein n=1 Tax=Streptomyces polyasparticus TaxID=2767826 RepID=A0ABR7SP16_9ACTN|nr:hypothetical protein [Streptomyces polyasparticus]MBC9716093.1 hypothetical protein [Streptomyces polyasparticus]